MIFRIFCVKSQLDNKISVRIGCLINLQSLSSIGTITMIITESFYKPHRSRSKIYFIGIIMESFYHIFKALLRAHEVRNISSTSDSVKRVTEICFLNETRVLKRFLQADFGIITGWKYLSAHMTILDEAGYILWTYSLDYILCSAC